MFATNTLEFPNKVFLSELCKIQCFNTILCVTCFQVFQYFISRVREKLHIVLCMSPVGDAFRSRCRMFPSLVNCCTIDWFVQVYSHGFHFSHGVYVHIQCIKKNP